MCVLYFFIMIGTWFLYFVILSMDEDTPAKKIMLCFASWLISSWTFTDLVIC